MTSVELRSVGKWVCQVKCEWENQTKDGTQMDEDDDDEQLQEELGDEASNWKRLKTWHRGRVGLLQRACR